MALAWLIVVAFAGSVAASPDWQDEPEQCEPIRVDMCSNLRYNYTKMPNFFNHRTQSEAFQEMQQYVPIVTILNCSVHLRFFLCSIFYPMCTSQHGGILVVEACRSMCMQLRKDCEPALNRLSIEWPQTLNCDRLPEGREGTLCMQPTDNPGGDAPGPGGPGRYEFAASTPAAASRSRPPAAQARTTTAGARAAAALDSMKPACPPRYVSISNGSQSCDDSCASSCDHCLPDCNYDIMYNANDKSLALVWTTVWSAVCMFSTLITICTFCIDSGRFKYPVRPVLFLAVCYFIYSSSYVIRFLSRPEDIICKTFSTGDKVMILDGVDNTLCIIVFLVQYYFGMAGSMWWTVLTLTWFLAACRKWGQEAIKTRACYFHLVAWGLPAIQTIVILVMGRVDGQELTGTCFVGNHDRTMLLAFVLVPLALHLAVGAALILAGFAALFRVRQRLKTAAAGSDIQKMEKLMAKIGVFAVLYTVPAMCVVGCLMYEYVNMERWDCAAKHRAKCDVAEDAGAAATCSITKSIPTVEIFIVKIFMSLAIGVTSCMWVLGPKSIVSWRSFVQRCRSRSAKAAPPGMQPHRPFDTVVVVDTNGHQPCVVPSGAGKAMGVRLPAAAQL